MRFVLCMLALAAIPAASLSQSGDRQALDRIAAVVGSEIILASELAQQMQFVVLQTGKRPQNTEEMKKIRHDILEQMVSDELLLQEAKKDTSIHVRPEEVEKALEEQIQKVSSRFKSNDEFLDALSSEGMTLRDLQNKFRGELESQLIKDRFVQKKLVSVSVSRHEVEDFFARFKDSIPAQPEAIRLAHILLKVSPSKEVEDSVRSFVTDLRQKVINGADFNAVSAQYSSPGVAPDSGQLGFVSRDDLVPEFARAAWALQDGDVSGVIRTQFGYHVIKCEARRGDRLKLRHLLVMVNPSGRDSANVQRLADSLLTVLRGGADFAEMAKTWSSDDESRIKGGELGWFALKQMPADFAGAVADWKTPNEYRGPVVSLNGLHILKLLEYQEEKRFTLPDDFDKLKELARQEKSGRLVEKWVAGIKARSFVEYRLDSLDEN